eukprot:Skav232785  [mRNA]  locus=scaffold614:189610:189870:+ [translate_table: standard]
MSTPGNSSATRARAPSALATSRQLLSKFMAFLASSRSPLASAKAAAMRCKPGSSCAKCVIAPCRPTILWSEKARARSASASKPRNL